MAFTLKNVIAGDPISFRNTLVASNTIAATATSTGTLVGLERFSICDLHLIVSAASGTSPTLDVYIQKLLADGTTWDDVGHFTQQTAAASNVMTLVAGNQAVHAQALRNVASATIRTTHFGNTWRVDVVVGGTNPSFTWALYGDFYS